MMKNQGNERQARAAMEAAKEKSEWDFSGKPAGPRRYKLYDKIKDHVSLRTVDIIIAVTAVLLVAALVVGIMTAQPPQ